MTVRRDLREIVSAIVTNRIIENTIRRSVRVRNSHLKLPLTFASYL